MIMEKKEDGLSTSGPPYLRRYHLGQDSSDTIPDAGDLIPPPQAKGWKSLLQPSKRREKSIDHVSPAALAISAPGLLELLSSQQDATLAARWTADEIRLGAVGKPSLILSSALQLSLGTGVRTHARRLQRSSPSRRVLWFANDILPKILDITARGCPRSPRPWGSRPKAAVYPSPEPPFASLEGGSSSPSASMAPFRFPDQQPSASGSEFICNIEFKMVTVHSSDGLGQCFTRTQTERQTGLAGRNDTTARLQVAQRSSKRPRARHSHLHGEGEEDKDRPVQAQQIGRDNAASRRW
ncbi:hypothetical protein CMUS01_13393 [Colletotrichum musicola]|uniref:Uncharacterized protein n=1 Tax=Colletotrichum musicola TaxID=2175873 RepID=A0A8H6MWH6_9PEZI|nr:hypothetical protein CMUS01_13393 [Colletotrichum musicola]